MKSYVLDANVIVRFLTQSPPAMGRAAKQLFEDADSGNVLLHLDTAIVAEVTFVLTKVYKIERMKVADALLELIESPGLRLAAVSVVRDALRRYRRIAVDFPDALIAALAAEACIPVASFDEDIDKFGDIKRFEPSVNN